MAERDRYIPGILCWIDMSRPDPEAAVEFHGVLFGWECEDVMPAGTKGKYFIARLHGGDVAAVGSVSESAPPTATRDLDGAKAFYGSVCGWDTLRLEGGFELWTLPGYGDQLERDDPDLRKRLAEFGGPTGFEDVVASLTRSPTTSPTSRRTGA
jgi:predicted enzyme related to lactoylglutathione lyase